MKSICSLETYWKEKSLLKPKEIEIVCSFFHSEILKKEEPLVKEGDRYSKIVFVEKGVFRVFVIDTSGAEIVKNFIEENNFFSDIEGFEKNCPAVINVSAVTDCTIRTLSKSDAGLLVQQLPEWAHLMKSGAIEAMGEMIRKQTFLCMGNSTDRYRHFIEAFPVLAQQVPLKYIASYLRITQSSLSRIRKQAW